MTLVGIEPGTPGQKYNALPWSQRVYPVRQLSESGYKRMLELSTVTPPLQGSHHL